MSCSFVGDVTDPVWIESLRPTEFIVDRPTNARAKGFAWGVQVHDHFQAWLFVKRSVHQEVDRCNQLRSLRVVRDGCR